MEATKKLCLEALNELGCATVSKLAEKTCYPQDSVSKVLNQLFKENKVNRIRFQVKRRSSRRVNIHLLFGELTGKFMYYTSEDALVDFVYNNILLGHHLTTPQKRALIYHLKTILPASTIHKLGF